MNKYLIIAAIAVLVIIVLPSFKKKPWENLPNPKPDLGKETKPTKPTQTTSTLLKYGDTGPMVKELQKSLNSHYLLPNKIAVDGVFGSQTEAALQTITGVKQTSLSNLNMLLSFL